MDCSHCAAVLVEPQPLVRWCLPKQLALSYAHSRPGPSHPWGVRFIGVHLQAIKSATAHGPRCLGDLGMAPHTGQLRPSYDADIIALSASPLDDVGVLARPDQVTHVWKAGRLYKSPEKLHAFTEQERTVPWSTVPRQGFAV